MGTFFSASGIKRYTIFLNISFLSLAFVVFILKFNSSGHLVLNSYKSLKISSQEDCNGFLARDGYEAKCLLLKTNNPCVSQGYIDYLYLFYCHIGGVPILGHFLLFLWLLVLFYLLGDTASEYFCTSLESLSKLWKLSPTIAGVTLLSLGNGAPDVFSSLVSFMGSDTADVGFNTVLGGASFVTCVVVGVISIVVRGREIRVNKVAFIRDVCCFFLVLAALLLMFLYGKINLWGALGLLLAYSIYVFVVYITHIRRNNRTMNSEMDDSSSCGHLYIPILSTVDKGEVNYIGGCALEDAEEETKYCFCMRSSTSYMMFLYILELPLYLPRRLTIPAISDKKWYKPIAVASVILSPLLLSALWSAQEENASINHRLLVYGIGLAFGITFGVLAYMTTENSSPPENCLFLWLVGGFIMSVAWSYIIAEELVALLVSQGYIFGISPNILGLTILAWGNSIGDLITNVTLAMNGGHEGVQVAISGCYAGPIFNILFGLGLSLVSSSWHAYPSSITISTDPYLMETLGFLLVGLLWALVILLRRKMRLDVVLGGGLVAIYLISLSLRLIQTLGFFQFSEYMYNPGSLRWE